MLKKNEWWLRANCAKEVCAKLGISCGESSYYRDIYVWLPDIRWNTMPPCVECGSNERVGPHAFRGNHDGVGPPSIVAGVCISPSSENITFKEKRGNGQREKDKKQRKPRSCKICSSQECPGRASGGTCRNKLANNA